MGSPTAPPPASSSRVLRVLSPLLLVPILLATAAQAQPQPPPRTYLETVCKPPTLRQGDLVPPCVSIEVIEALCFPNGTTPLHLEAHAQCMCKGSYFAEWTACRACLSLHGLLADRHRDFYQGVAVAASSALCGFLDDGALPRPTAPFKALFSAAEAATPGRPTGVAAGGGGAGGGQAPSAPGPDDRFPSRTEVSLYYVPTSGGAAQGPGPITGSAASATATGLEFATGRPSLPGPPPAPAPAPGTTTTTGGPGAASSTAHHPNSGTASPSGSAGAAAPGSAAPSGPSAMACVALLLGAVGLAVVVLVS